MCSYILDFRFPDRRKNWDLLQYFCFKNNCFLKQIIIFAPKNVPPLQLYLWQIWSILKTVFMNKALWSLCTKSQFANLHHILYEFTQLQNRSVSICWEAMRTKGWNCRSKDPHLNREGFIWFVKETICCSWGSHRPWLPHKHLPRGWPYRGKIQFYQICLVSAMDLVVFFMLGFP